MLLGIPKWARGSCPARGPGVRPCRCAHPRAGSPLWMLRSRARAHPYAPSHPPAPARAVCARRGAAGGRAARAGAARGAHAPRGHPGLGWVGLPWPRACPSARRAACLPACLPAPPCLPACPPLRLLLSQSTLPGRCAACGRHQPSCSHCQPPTPPRTHRADVVAEGRLLLVVANLPTGWAVKPSRRLTRPWSPRRRGGRGPPAADRCQQAGRAAASAAPAGPGPGPPDRGGQPARRQVGGC